MIHIERANEEMLKELGVYSWPIWEKEVSKFEWYYDDKEICYILDGHAIVSDENGKNVEFSTGNLVTFPKGLKCVWDIKKAIRKHYKFG